MDFDQLFREHNAKLVRYLRKHFKDDADDIAQNTWMKVMAKLDSFDPTRDFTPWLITIARRTGLDFQRRKRTREKGLSNEKLSAAEHCCTEVRKISDVVADLDTGRAVLEQCSPDAREVVELVALDYTQPEIAKRLGLPLSVVKARLHRARRGL